MELRCARVCTESPGSEERPVVALVETVISLPVPYEAVNFLTS
jgi:hypothetical protein